MTETSAPTAPDVVILLPEVPASMGDVFGLVAPVLAEALSRVPPTPRLRAPINGVELDLGLHPTPCADPALAADLANSPIRAELDEPVAAHRAHATISWADDQDDVWAGLDLVTNVAASILDKSAATAVWLPHQLMVITDVLYVGDVTHGQPERTWFRAHAMWRDDARTESVAFTRGLARFGWPELQVHGAQPPSDLWQALTAGVGDRLAARHPAPRPEEAFSIDRTTHVLRPGTDILGDPVLDLVATPPAREKRSWFRRRR